jgi:tRNA pseudouridine13 synthase
MNALEHCAYAYGRPSISAFYKTQPADFEVHEELSFAPEGKGEHLYLHIEKSGLSTQEVQQQLMRFFKRPGVDVSFSGMKDKQALTRQWFSVRLPNSGSKSIEDLNHPQLRVLESVLNTRKLKRGSHRCNHFRLILRKLSKHPDALQEKLQQIRENGVPNYFGEQRFGWQGSNISSALAYFAGDLPVKSPYKRGLYLSAARATLFNQVLSQRVEQNNWQRYLDGDVMQLNGSMATFMADSDDPQLSQRIAEYDIHPTGPLWGKGDLQSCGQCAELENKVALENPRLKDGLEQAGLAMQRRALRSNVSNLRSRQLNEDELELTFTLNRGAYATVLLRELVILLEDKQEQFERQDNETAEREYD